MNTKIYLSVITGLIMMSISQAASIMSVNGTTNPSQLGKTLPHEHVMVDFIGAELADPCRYEPNEIVDIMLPCFMQIKDKGYSGFVDCTPAYLGRDVIVLRELSKRSGLHILTNTGYYGAGQNKYLPKDALTQTAQQLAKIWIKNG